MMKYILLLLSISANVYANCEISTEKPHIYNRTMDMIGDSIISTRDGAKMRCILDEKGVSYDFVGEYLDPYGYKHDAHAGDSTQVVLNKIDSLPIADTYFILLGVNDVNNKSSTPLKTYKNLILIVDKLREKNQNCKIYISTLLPLDRLENNYIEEVNKLLKNDTNYHDFDVIDLGGYFLSQENWKELLLDKIHPNSSGYNVITDFLSQYIK